MIVPSVVFEIPKIQKWGPLEIALCGVENIGTSKMVVINVFLIKTHSSRVCLHLQIQCFTFIYQG